MTNLPIVTAWHALCEHRSNILLARAHLRVQAILGPHPCPVPTAVLDLTDDAQVEPVLVNA